jgi:hypothetical protein
MDERTRTLLRYSLRIIIRDQIRWIRRTNAADHQIAERSYRQTLCDSWRRYLELARPAR